MQQYTCLTPDACVGRRSSLVTSVDSFWCGGKEQDGPYAHCAFVRSICSLRFCESMSLSDHTVSFVIRDDIVGYLTLSTFKLSCQRISQ